MRFEFDKYDNAQNIDVYALDKFLQEVWQQQSKELTFEDSRDNVTDKDILKQPYLKIRDNKFKPRNYIGFIYFEGKTIEIYPKVFQSKLNANNKNIAFNNILYWLTYYHKFKNPYLNTDLNTQDFDSFPELFLYLITKFITNTVYKYLYYQFEEIKDTLYTPEGRIDFNDYGLNKLPKGEWHKIDCVYEPFIYDNMMNRVIKYTCSLINSITKNPRTKKLLQEIFFIMDEVSYRICTVADIDSIFVNPLFEEYEDILFYCRMIIEQQIYSNQTFEIKQLCFLFPMEKIFEDFVYAKLRERISIERQKSHIYLTKINGKNVFRLQFDIYSEKPPFIIDTKYKIRAETDNEKYGISQTDMYQLLSYSFKTGIKNLYLFYPNTVEFSGENLNNAKTYIIDSQYRNINLKINITALNVPFWSLQTEINKTKEQINNLYKEIADFLDNRSTSTD